MPLAKGQELSRRFYHEAVRPILDRRAPRLPHSAALLGRGSEVLGFDDDMSRDHNWEPRALLFLSDEDHARHHEALDEALRAGLPATFEGRQTDFGVHTIRGYVQEQLKVDIEAELHAADWLALNELRLGMFTAGAVFHDDIGLQAVRDRFAYYPRDVWLYLMIGAWWRVHPEANLVGRSGDVGDELGSAIIGARMVHELMRLCFLLERKYAPYSKWFGTAFSRLACGPELSPLLWNALRAETWQQREAALLKVYEKVAAMHNALGITEPVDTGIHRIWDRPYQVYWGDFPGALHAEIKDPEVKEIAERWPTGSPPQ
ncbi:DUF4037 domain-containing protein [Flindersiella endophytica]